MEKIKNKEFHLYRYDGRLMNTCTYIPIYLYNACL